MILTRNRKIDMSADIILPLWSIVFFLSSKLYSGLQVATLLIELSLSISIKTMAEKQCNIVVCKLQRH